MAIKASTLGIIFCSVPSAAVSTGCFLHNRANGGNGNGTSLTVGESEVTQRSSREVREPAPESPPTVQRENSPESTLGEEAFEEEAHQEPNAKDETKETKDSLDLEDTPKALMPEFQPSEDDGADSKSDTAPSRGVSESESSPVIEENVPVASEQEVPTITTPESRNEGRIDSSEEQYKPKPNSEGEKITKEEQPVSNPEQENAPEKVERGWKEWIPNGIWNWATGTR